MHKLSVVGLAILLGLFVVTNVAAQGTMIGGKAGFNVSDLSVDEAPGEVIDMRTDFVGGGFVSFPIGESFAIQPEVLYARKGAKIDDFDEDAELEAKLDYIEIPVLLVARLTDQNSAARPIVYAGPAVSFEVNCELEGTVEAVSASADCDRLSEVGADENIETKGTDFGLVFGGGVEFDAGSAVIIIEGRYNVGLVDINDATEDDEIKNRAFSFMAGIGFPIGP
ncbi:MAG: porin family protein [Gemmatimonadota bacterium]|jgi:hypothetical protein